MLRLTQKRPGFNRPLAEVKRQIQQRLFRDMRTKAMDAFVADLKKKSTIEINEENLAKVVDRRPARPAGLRACRGRRRRGCRGLPPGAARGLPAGAAAAGTPAARPVPQGKP